MFLLHKRKHSCLLGGTYLSKLSDVWSHGEGWGDSRGDPFGVGGFPASRIVSSFSSQVQV